MNNTARIKSLVAALVAAACLSPLAGGAVTVVDVERTGAEKILVSVDVQGTAFSRTLVRNLVLSGAFRVVKPEAAAVKVTGQAGVEVVASGRGKRLTLPSSAADDKAARMEARRFADTMTETYAAQKGFAATRIAFVCKKGKSEELCVGYADGADIRQLTQDGRASVGPRWKNADTIYYTGYLNNAPQVFEIGADEGRRRLAWGFGGLTTGATPSPDGKTVALILSKPFGNPELCTIDAANGSWSRLTTTRTANEGQPAWSPDGKKIVYVSDESRRQHLYVIDVASKTKRRLTSLGSQNVDPDWGRDGRIVYTARSGGSSRITVVDPAEGDKSAKAVTEPGNWEHPSWARDGRHVVAERDGVLFLVDTAADGEKPVQLFAIQGKCITPSWFR